MIEGSLRNVPLADVFQIVATGRKSGVLTVVAGEARARVYLEGGEVQLAHVTPGVHLGEVLARLDLLSAEEVQELLERQRGSDAALPLGTAAVQTGKLAQEDLHRALRRQAVEVIADLLAWRDGSFSFAERNLAASQVPPEHTYDAMSLLMEAAALREELDEGRATPSTLYRRAGDPTEVELPPDAWEVLGLIDGRRSARSIASDTDLGEERTYGLLAVLERHGVIEPQPFAQEEPLVLAVSPSAGVQRLLRLALQRVGLRVRLARGGEAALAALQEERPHVVVVDDRDGEGWAFVRELRGLPRLGHLPAVVVCDDPRGGPLARWRRPRAHALARPFDELELQQLVSRLAGRPLT